jgi:hypothetical protein
MPNRDDVERRAYELFEQRGGEAGHDVDDWFEAERELKTAEESVQTEPNPNNPSGMRQTRRRDQRSTGMIARAAELDRS